MVTGFGILPALERQEFYPTVAYVSPLLRVIDASWPAYRRGSTSSHPIPWGDAAMGGKSTCKQYLCRVCIRRRPMVTCHTAEPVPAPAAFVRHLTTFRTGLRGVFCAHPDQDARLPMTLVGEHAFSLAPCHSENRPVQAGLGSHVNTGL